MISLAQIRTSVFFQFGPYFLFTNSNSELHVAWEMYMGQHYEYMLTFACCKIPGCLKINFYLGPVQNV